ncbi:MAG: hypothetical protein JWP59_4529 [Massilia sp.]|nr:hypothetical protein [Massilia sp.]
MRIVIDLQTVQLNGIDGGKAQCAVGLTEALLRATGDHVIMILLNSALPDIGPLRRHFDGLLTQGQIYLFEGLASTGFEQTDNGERRHTSELLRDYTIAQLHADAVIVGGPFDGFSDDSIWSQGRLAGDLCTAVLLQEVPASERTADPAVESFLTGRRLQIAEADMVLALPTAAATAADLRNETALQIDLRDFDLAAAAVLSGFSQHIASKIAREPVQRTRRRLAFVTPLPPERTGIADYAVQLLPAMLDDFDITLVIDQTEVTLPPALAVLPRHDPAWLTRNTADFDQILYQFGNSPFHSSMFALLRQHPGTVVLHDFYLSNVLAYEQMTGGIPNAWSDALFKSHGFSGLRASQLPNNHAEAMNDYPCNLEVLEGASRVIVHSTHAVELAREWYGEQAARHWTVVPLPREAPPLQDRHAARAALGIGDDVFLVCTFGYIGPTKLSDVLVDAWLASKLGKDTGCLLVLVGANHAGEFGANLAETIRLAGAGDTVRIAGWTDEPVYRQYLQAADLGIQLRTTSRGETSAAVLDVMNYGLPCIVNANGSMATLPGDAVWMLADRCEAADIVVALEALHADPMRRAELGSRAREVLATRHRPEHCATLYRDALDLAMAESQSNRHAFMRKFSAIASVRKDDRLRRKLAEGLARAPAPLAQRQLLVDVSTIAHHDLKTGIERVVRTQLLELLNLPQRGFRVEPVLLSTEGNRWHFRYARRYGLQLMGIDAPAVCDAPIDIQPGDVFYCADYAPAAVVEAARAGVYAHLRSHGVEVNFLIHDLLPVLRPEFFPSNAQATHANWLRCIAANADRLICISAAVAAETVEWLSAQDVSPSQMLPVAVLHHGADIDHVKASVADHSVPVSITETLAKRPSFLMVGTIEPRKGHLQALAAFEQLWAAGKQVNLVIVGNEGWKNLPEAERRTIPEIVRRLRDHAEAGQRLHWLQGVDDALLEVIYRDSECLLQPSEGEGFGLPLIEAARHNLPIIARGLPVFREVAGEHAVYFEGMAPADLAEAVVKWLALRDIGEVPGSAGMRWHSWRDNAQQLLRLLGGGKRSAQWSHASAIANLDAAPGSP